VAKRKDQLMNGGELMSMRLAELLLPQIGRGFDRTVDTFDHKRVGVSTVKPGALTVQSGGIDRTKWGYRP
jgi:hypothetical protein